MSLPIADIATHPKPFVTIEDLAEYLEVSRRTLYHHIEKGTLKANRIGGRLKIPIQEAQRFCSVPARNGQGGQGSPSALHAGSNGHPDGTH